MTWATEFFQSQLDKYFRSIKRPEAPHLRHQGKVETNLPIPIHKEPDTRPFKFMQEHEPCKPSLFTLIDTHKPKKEVKKMSDEKKSSFDAILRASGGSEITTTPIRIHNIDELPQPVKKIYVDTHSPKFN